MRIGITGWIATGLACCTVGNVLAAQAIDPSLLSDPVATARWTSATILVIGSSARPGAPAVYEEIHAETAMAIGNRAFSPLPQGGGQGEVAPNSFAIVCSTTCAHKKSHVAVSCHQYTSRIAWVKMVARAGEKFSLACSNCSGDIRLISFNTQPKPIQRILVHVVEPVAMPHMSPGQGPSLDWVRPSAG